MSRAATVRWRTALALAPTAASGRTTSSRFDGLHPIALVTTAIALAGVGFRLWQFALDRQLWLDEAGVTVGIVRPWSELISPLPHNQTAPIGFLFLQKIATLPLGPTEYALRLVPLLLGIAAVFVFIRLALKELPPSVVPVAVALFALAPIGIYLSAEAKQYAYDLFIGTVLLLAVVRRTNQDRRALLLVGLAAPWFSQQAVFVLAGVGIWLLMTERKFGLVSAWGMSALISILATRVVMSPHTMSTMHGFWASGFVPWSSHGFKYASSLLIQAFSVFDTGGGNTDQAVVPIALLAFSLAIIAVFRMRTRYAPYVLPVAVFMLAAALHLYPFGGPQAAGPFPARVIVVLLPSFSMLTAAGLAELAAKAPRLAVALGTYVVIGVGASAAVRIPEIRQEERPLLARIAAERKAGDVLHLFTQAKPSFDIYAARFGLDTMQVTYGDMPQPEEITGRTWLLLVKDDMDPASFERAVAALGPNTCVINEPRAKNVGLVLYDPLNPPCRPIRSDGDRPASQF